MADKKKKSVFAEFKEFISKGNVIDMAVGVIIGGAFTKIVNSLVSDLIMPALGLLTGDIDFADLKIVLAEAVMEGETVVKEELAIRYGVFLDALLNFLLIAIAVFFMVKIINTAREKAEKLKKKKEEEAPAAPPAPDPQIVLLTEIRDLLKKDEAVETEAEAVTE
ncbi:MAG: large-conductance mechanosensitive channel protein MscL [Oscillospiraceae bacterium]|nr:large-conductance mechanosensitive channel protein MscL [Oscillospiraceae bacterium]